MGELWVEAWQNLFEKSLMTFSTFQSFFFASGGPFHLLEGNTIEAQGITPNDDTSEFQLCYF